MRVMHLYHRRFDTDQEARSAFEHDDPAIVRAGGTSWTSIANGAGPAYHVVVLPEDVAPADLGIENAELKTSFEADLEVNEDEVPLGGEEEEEEAVEEALDDVMAYVEEDTDGE